MNDKLEEIFENTIPHSTFLDKKSIISCMYQSHQLGQIESEEKYNKLTTAFKSLLKTLDFDEQTKEDWKKRGGLL
jgi:lipoate-protein ligase A